MSPVPLCLEKWGVMTPVVERCYVLCVRVMTPPQLLWERRPCKQPLSKLLTYCMYRPTQATTLSGMGNEY